MKRKRIVVILLAIIMVFAVSFPSATSADARNIVKGDTQANIRAVQTRLSTLGYYKMRVDGIWGPRTLSALRNFQRDYGLVVDGIVGSWTERSLRVTLNSSSSGGGGGSASSTDLNLLAKCVNGEARGEPYQGQVAVASVVLNRVKDSRFPNSVSGVIYQPGAFTCVADGQINRAPSQTSINAARDALNGFDPTHGCLYFYNPATSTSKWIWSLTVETSIGRHNFAKA